MNFHDSGIEDSEEDQEELDNHPEADMCQFKSHSTEEESEHDQEIDVDEILGAEVGNEQEECGILRRAILKKLSISLPQVVLSKQKKSVNKEEHELSTVFVQFVKMSI